MIEFSSSLKLNEIHVVDSSFNEKLKNIIFPKQALISGEERPENLGKMGITGTSIVMQIGDDQFRKRISAPTSGTKILVMPQFPYMPDQILGKKWKNSIFRPNFDLSLGSPLPKYKNVFKNF